MASKKYTTSVKFSLEFVRKGKDGLELVKVNSGKETVTPVQITTQIGKRNRLIVGIEPRFINGKLEVF